MCETSSIRSRVKISGLELRNQIISNVRKETGISYNMAELAFDVVIENLLAEFPHIKPNFIHLIHNQSNNNQILTLSSSIGDPDGDRLKELFSLIVTAKEDSQQRSWSLHEDEAIILAQAEEILNLLNEGNPSAVKLVIEYNEYEYLHNLTVFYQMEPRTSIRLILLKCFAVLCTWDRAIVLELIMSILLTELVRDLLATNDELRISYTLIVLTLIFSIGETIPLNHYKQLNSDFINYVLDGVESSENDSDLFFKLILSYNLHFKNPSSNHVMQELAKRQSDKILPQTLLLYFNREDDPIRTCDKLTHDTNSVIKFVSDIFSSRSTGNYFYTNDLNVLVDILIRQLNNLSTTDMMRIEYLVIVQLLLENSNYLDDGHKKTEDLKKCLQQIESEDETSAIGEKKIVDKILSYIDDS